MWDFGPVPGEAGSSFTRPTVRLLVLSLLRILGIVVTVGLVYVWIPVTTRGETGNWLVLVIGLGVFCGVLVWQGMAVMHSPRPVGRAIEALCICVSIYLTIFALQYLAESQDAVSAFTQPLDKLAAVYYTVTVFATVGFGDIAPVSSVARAITTTQMILNLVVIGVGVRLLTGLAQERLKIQRSETALEAVEEAVED